MSNGDPRRLFEQEAVPEPAAPDMLSPDAARELFETGHVDAEPAGATEQRKPGLMRTFQLQYTKGATKGFADELGGAVADASLPPTTYPQGYTGPRQSPGEFLKQEWRAEDAAQNKEYPWAAPAFQTAGELSTDYVASRLIPGGAAIMGPAGQIVSGAISGAGNAPEGERLWGAVKGAAVNAAGQAAGHFVIGPVLRRIFGKGSANMAANALGGKATPENAKLGQKALDAGLIRAGSTPKETFEAATAKLDELGPHIGKVYDAADKAAEQTGKMFDWAPAMDRIQGEILDNASTVGQREFQPILKELIKNAAQSADDVGFSAAGKLKSDLAGKINWHPASGDSPLKQQMAKKALGIIQDELDNQIDDVLGNAAGKEFKQARNLYGILKGMQRLGKKASDEPGLASTIAGGAVTSGLTAATGGVVPALVAGEAGRQISNSLFRRVPSALAVAGNAVNQGLEGPAGQALGRGLTAAEMAMLRAWQLGNKPPEGE